VKWPSRHRVARRDLAEQRRAHFWWAWKKNPVGTFANWNPNVSCDAFNPPPAPPDG
jgi:hypothetical protein